VCRTQALGGVAILERVFTTLNGLSLDASALGTVSWTALLISVNDVLLLWLCGRSSQLGSGNRLNLR
jgi:hypothetical protein